MDKQEVIKTLQRMPHAEYPKMIRLVSGDAVIEFNGITGNYVLVTERFHVIFDGFCPGPVDSNAVLLKHGGIIFARMNCNEFEEVKL